RRAGGFRCQGTPGAPGSPPPESPAFGTTPAAPPGYGREPAGTAAGRHSARGPTRARRSSFDSRVGPRQGCEKAGAPGQDQYGAPRNTGPGSESLGPRSPEE